MFRLLLCFFLCFLVFGCPVWADSWGTVTWVSGELRITPHNPGLPRPATAGQAINPGDRLQVLTGSSVILSFSSGNLRLCEKSILVISSEAVPKGKLLYGRAWFHSTEKRPFAIMTPQGEFGSSEPVSLSVSITTEGTEGKVLAGGPVNFGALSLKGGERISLAPGSGQSSPRVERMQGEDVSLWDSWNLNLDSLSRQYSGKVPYNQISSPPPFLPSTAPSAPICPAWTNMSVRNHSTSVGGGNSFLPMGGSVGTVAPSASTAAPSGPTPINAGCGAVAVP